MVLAMRQSPIADQEAKRIDLIDFYVLPHYLTAPFKKVTEKIMTEFSDTFSNNPRNKGKTMLV